MNFVECSRFLEGLSIVDGAMFLEELIFVECSINFLEDSRFAGGWWLAAGTGRRLQAAKGRWHAKAGGRQATSDGQQAPGGGGENQWAPNINSSKKVNFLKKKLIFPQKKLARL